MRYTEVDDLDMAPILRVQKVSWFDIAMNYTLMVDLTNRMEASVVKNS